MKTHKTANQGACKACNGFLLKKTTNKQTNKHLVVNIQCNGFLKQNESEKQKN